MNVVRYFHLSNSWAQCITLLWGSQEDKAMTIAPGLQPPGVPLIISFSYDDTPTCWIILTPCRLPSLKLCAAYQADGPNSPESWRSHAQTAWNVIWRSHGGEGSQHGIMDEHSASICSFQHLLLFLHIALDQCPSVIQFWLKSTFNLARTFLDWNFTWMSVVFAIAKMLLLNSTHVRLTSQPASKSYSEDWPMSDKG